MPDRLAIATALIKHTEGCRLAPYQDMRGRWTIGWGNRFTVDGGGVCAATQTLAAYQADALLIDTLLGGTMPRVRSLVHVALSEPQAGALISLAYNIGGDAFAASTMLRLINATDLVLAAEQFHRWTLVDGYTVKGLVARRALERAVYLGTVDPIALLPSVLGPCAADPTFANPATTYELTADQLNARQLALLRPSPTIPA